jgi:SAM-dependent methyltransferase
VLAGLPGRALARAGVEPGAAVIDAGAGRGNLRRLLETRGYRAEAIDPSPRGPGVVRAGIEEHTAADLDAVVLWHVLEHVPDPAEALRRVHGWLRPDGVVLVGVPNVASLQAGIAAREWFHLDLPRHRTHFTPRGLRELLVRARFAPERTYHLVTEHNFYGMWFALLGRLGMTPGFPFHLVKRNVGVNVRDLLLLVVAGTLLLVPAIVLELVAAAMHRGGTIAVVARAQSSP